MQAHAQECAAAIRAGGFDLLLAHPCQFFISPHIGRAVGGGLPKVLYLQEPYRFLYEAMPRLAWVSPPEGNQGVGSGNLASRILDRAKGHARYGYLRFLALEELANARAFDRILVNSYYSAECIQRAYGMAATVSYLGVNEGLFRSLDRPREQFVVGLGSLSWSKGVDLAIEALAILPESHRPSLVWVCNAVDRPYRDEMTSRARVLGVNLDVRMLVSDTELIELLNRAVAMLYTARLEPFGYAPVEANLCGTPVVAVAEGGVRETVRDGWNGLTVSRNPKMVAAAIRRLVDDPALARRLGEQGRRGALAEWNIEKSIDRLEECLGEVMDERGGADQPTSRRVDDASVR